MARERTEIRGTLSLGTLVRISLVTGLAIGVMFGVFAGMVSFMASRQFLNLLIFVVVTPPAVALLLTLVTMIGHPLYSALNRAGVRGLDRIVYEPTEGR